MFRFLIIAALVLCLPACAVVYKLPTRQGNVLDQKQFDQLKLGMTRDQVHYLLGTPVASSSFDPDRWDYFGYYKPPRGKPVTRTVTLYFAGDKLASVEGTQLAKNSDVLGTPDVETMKKATKKSAEENPPEDGQPGGANLPN